MCCEVEKVNRKEIGGMTIGMNVAGCKKGSDSRMSLLYVHGAGRGRCMHHAQV